MFFALPEPLREKLENIWNIKNRTLGWDKKTLERKEDDYYRNQVFEILIECITDLYVERDDLKSEINDLRKKIIDLEFYSEP